MTVLSERHDKVEIITINRPEVRNAIDPPTLAALSDAFDAAEANRDVWAVILTGTGDKAFSSGQDLKALASGDGLGSTERDRSSGFSRVVDGSFTKPLIAAVNGPAVAGGFEIVLACDLAVAAEHATFSLPEVKRGLVAVAGGVIRLPQRVSLAIALELLLTGEPIAAARAAALGLVNRVVPGEQVLAEAVALAAKTCENSPRAVRASKRLARQTFDLSEAQAWDLNWQLARELMGSEDVKEGAQAFIEKRSPRWTPP